MGREGKRIPKNVEPVAFPALPGINSFLDSQFLVWCNAVPCGPLAQLTTLATDVKIPVLLGLKFIETDRAMDRDLVMSLEMRFNTVYFPETFDWKFWWASGFHL